MPKGAYKVKVTIGDATVEVEGQEKGVVAIVRALNEVVRTGRKSAGTIPVSPSTLPSSPEPSHRSGHTDIRSFFLEKHPSTDVEATAVVAYYHKYLAPPDERRDAIDPSTLQDAFRLAGRPLPTKTAYTLWNARTAGYLDSTGDTGLYRLNPVGFNLVEHTLGKTDVGGDKNSKRKRKPNSRKGKTQQKK